MPSFTKDNIYCLSALQEHSGCGEGGVAVAIGLVAQKMQVQPTAMVSMTTR